MDEAEDQDEDESAAALRVSQLDAGTLDTELENIIDAQLRRFLECIPIDYDFASRFEPELTATLKTFFWYFVFRPHGATIGQTMMDMSYRSRTNNRPLNVASKWAYFVLTIVAPWIRRRLPWILGKLAKNQDNVEEVENRSERAMERWSNVMEVANLLHFVWFLNRGGFRTWMERALGFRAVHNSTPLLSDAGNEDETELTERELLWHGFSDILIFFVPLVNYRRFWNGLKRLGRTIRRRATTRTSDEEEKKTMNDRKIKMADLRVPCSYCDQTPPVLPCRPVGCRHFYCYYCLAANLGSDANFACVICGELVSSDRGSIQFVIGSKMIE